MYCYVLVELYNRALPGNYTSVSDAMTTALQNAINLAYMQDIGCLGDRIASSRDKKQQIIYQLLVSFGIEYFWHNKLRKSALFNFIGIV